jgi:hypothetical protein
LIESVVLAIAAYLLGSIFDDALHCVDLPGPLFDVLFPIGVVLERMPWLAVILWIFTISSVVWLAGDRRSSRRAEIVYTAAATIVVSAVGILVALIGVATVYQSQHPLALAVIVGLVVAFLVGRWSMARAR